MLTKLKKKKANLKQDKEKLLIIASKSFNNSFEPRNHSDEDFIKSLKKVKIFIYFYNNQPIGFWGCKEDKDKAHLKIICVIEKYKGKGVGKEMIKDFNSIYSKKNLYTFTHPKNSKALILYLKSGFEIYKWADNYLNDGQPRIFLRLIRKK